MSMFESSELQRRGVLERKGYTEGVRERERENDHKEP